MTSTTRPSTTKPGLADLHHVGITVSDIERSVRFYRDVLGLLLVRRRSADGAYLGEQTGYPGVRMEAASFKVAADSPQSFEIVQYATHAGGTSNPATNLAGNAHLCFRVDDIQLVYESFTAQGVRFRSPPVAITSGPNQGGFVVYFYDPDGFTLEMFQPPQGA